MNSTTSPASSPAADFNRALDCPNAGEAFDSLLRAAEGGCLRAQFLVGLAYQTGHGVAVDYPRAAAWYREAAGSGDSYAMANLGVMSLLGQGAPADDLDAYAWVQSAVGLGHRWLCPALEALERRVAGIADCSARRVLADLAPHAPDLRPCVRPVCDHSLCNVA